MRDIEFRAFCKSFKRMLSFEHLKEATKGMVDVANAEIQKRNINFNKLAPYGLFLPLEDDDLIFMQYTGLKDKNGTKIFEGDIVKNSNGQLYTIRYICGGFDCEPIKEFYKAFKITWNTLGEIQNASWCESNCEVIGNIYDNPELLEKKDD